MATDPSYTVRKDKIHGIPLADAVVHAIRQDVESRGIPDTLRDWNARQLDVCDLVCEVYGVSSIDALAIIARVFNKLCPRTYVHAR